MCVCVCVCVCVGVPVCVCTCVKSVLCDLDEGSKVVRVFEALPVFEPPVTAVGGGLLHAA